MKGERRAYCNGARDLSIGTLQEKYHLPLRVAAGQLGVSVARLLKVCRQYCILRWPFRQVRSLRDTNNELRRDIAEAAAAGQGASVQQLLQRRLKRTARKEE
ncbi:unnamed protein product, partial [Phaeothamnion confervicola]